MVTRGIVCSAVVQWSKAEAFAAGNAEMVSKLELEDSFYSRNWERHVFVCIQMSVYTNTSTCMYVTAHSRRVSLEENAVITRWSCSTDTDQKWAFFFFGCLCEWKLNIRSNLNLSVSLSFYQVQSRSTETVSASAMRGWIPPQCSPLPPPHLLLCHQNVSWKLWLFITQKEDNPGLTYFGTCLGCRQINKI